MTLLGMKLGIPMDRKYGCKRRQPRRLLQQHQGSCQKDTAPVQVVAQHGTKIDGAAVKAMTYTDAVVKEILRLHPIVGGTFRRALTDFNLCGYYVPKVHT